MKLRLYIHYMKEIFWINFAISGLFAFFSPIELTLFSQALLSNFLIFFASIGYGLTVMTFHYFNKSTLYIYFNKGISIIHLYIVGFIFNLLLMFVLFTMVNCL